MGKQPDSEEPIEEPVSEQAVEEDVEVIASLDLSLHCQDQCGFVDYEETPLAMCQICMDIYGSTEVVRNICGPQCPAEICASCLVQHLTATVYSFYPGVLPKMRCPVCLVLLNKTQWKKFVAAAPAAPTPTPTPANNSDTAEVAAAETEGEGAQEQEAQAQEGAQEAAPANPPPQETAPWVMDNLHVLDKFEILCRQSCGFQAPCCHNAEYTMLARVREEIAEKSVTLALPKSQALHLPQLSGLYHEYCFHRVEVGDLYDFLVAKFAQNAGDVLRALVMNTLDDERRANLLLLDLFYNPDTYTACCGHEVCFKCKAATHHDGDCGDFIVDENLLDCPGCRVTLVKVDGCDTVTCLCGHTIEWPLEMEKQRLQRKQLAPADNKLYAQWRRWASKLDTCLAKIEVLVAQFRQQRLERMLRDHRGVLQQLVDRAVRRARLNILIREHGNRLRSLLRAHLARRKLSNGGENTTSSLLTKSEDNAGCLSPEETILAIAPAA